MTSSEKAIATLADNANCIPFALLYWIAPDGKQAHLAEVTGPADGTAAVHKLSIYLGHRSGSLSKFKPQGNTFRSGKGNGSMSESEAVFTDGGEMGALMRAVNTARDGLPGYLATLLGVDFQCKVGEIL